MSESLVDTMSSEDGKKTGAKKNFGWYLKNIGPAVLVCMTIMGPGTMSALIKTGAAWSYSMLWAVVVSVIFAAVATWLATKVTCITGKNPVEAINEYIHPGVTWFLVGVNFITQFFVLMAEGRGLASAGSLLLNPPNGLLSFNIPTVIIAAVLVIIVCLAYYYKGSFSFVQKITWAMLTFVLLCFVFCLLLSKPDFMGMLRGLIPNWPPVFEGLLPLPAAAEGIAGIVGGAAGLYIYMYHGFALKEDKWDNKEHIDSAKWDIIFHNVIMFGAFSIFIFVVSAAVLYPTGKVPSGIEGAALSLGPLLGPAAQVVFTLGWLGAVMTTTAGCAFFGFTPLAYLLGIKPSLQDKRYRFWIIVYTLIPAMFIGPFLSGDALSVMVKGMALNNLVTPPGILVFLYLTNKKKIMGDASNGILLNIVTIIMFLVVSVTAVGSAKTIFSF